ncbi:small multi-drug export protein [Helicobacter sp. MIT 11-5569]|uniref:small multi-drug export protein n=1 Tax=Helicobacter sp. MIT 11-5569 TaxID=1548151 RepID=UPI000A484ACD|nr:small multi-drug export protein [Helicobacter sp. MIT 11-5569]
MRDSAFYRFISTQFDSIEAKLFLCGIILLIFYGFAILVCLLLQNGLGDKLLSIVLSSLIFGRAAGISLALALELSTFWAIILNIYIENTMVLILYPLFVWSIQGMRTFQRAERFFDSLNQVAQKYEKLLKRYGIIGLFLFVWLPFWLTGPIVGAAIGYFMRLKVWLNLLIVLSGTNLAILCWAYLLERLDSKLKYFGQNTMWVLLGIFISLATFGAIFAKFRQKGKKCD